jgi:anti-sigma regulatory factor (Ser/Thr protein kinase)
VTAGTVTVAVTVPGDLSEVRHRVQEVARRHEFDPGRGARLVLAVNEIVTNAISHGVPPATVTISVTERAFVVAVHDRGAGFSPTGTGTGAPSVDRVDGRGLWLAHRLCDRVDVRTVPSGTTVTLTLYR